MDIRIANKTDEVQVIGAFKFYGTQADLTSIGQQLIDKAQLIAIGWVDIEDKPPVNRKITVLKGVL